MVSLVSLGLTWSGFTWIHLDSLGLTWTHLDSLGLTWIHLDSLGFTSSSFEARDQRHRGLPGSGPTALGGARPDSCFKFTKKMPNLTRTCQDSPNLTQEAPQIAYELAEPLFIQFRIHDPSQEGRARARAGEHSPSFGGPALRTTSSRRHTQLRIARTNETKRFPGLGGLIHTPNLRSTSPRPGSRLISEVIK